MRVYEACVLYVKEEVWVFMDSTGKQWEVRKDTPLEGGRSEVTVGMQADLHFDDLHSPCRLVKVTTVSVFSPSKSSISTYFQHLPLTDTEKASCAFIQTYYADIRKTRTEGGSPLAFGVAYMENFAGKIDQIHSEVRREIERKTALREYLKVENAAKWLESQWNNEDFATEVISVFRALYISNLRTISTSQSNPHPDEYFFQTMSQVLQVKLVVYFPEQVQLKHTYRDPETMSRDTLHFLVTRRYSYYVLYGKQESEICERDDMIRIIETIWKLAKIIKNAVSMWRIISEIMETEMRKLIEKLENAVIDLKQKYSGVTVPSTDIFPPSKSRCFKCGVRQSEFDVGCHLFCFQCLYSIFDSQLSTYPYSPSCTCSVPLSLLTVYEALGAYAYRELVSRMPVEGRRYACDECQLWGSTMEIYVLKCGCCLCIHCVSENIKHFRRCKCGLEFPIEIQTYLFRLCLNCIKCNYDLPFLTHFPHTPCHPICKQCALSISHQALISCSACDRLYSDMEKTRLINTLYGICRECRLEKPYVEMRGLSCDCEVCEKCVMQMKECPFCRKGTRRMSVKEKELWQRRRVLSSGLRSK